MWNEYNFQKCFEDVLFMLEYRSWITKNEIKTAQTNFDSSADKSYIVNNPFKSKIENEFLTYNVILYLEEDSIDISKLDNILKNEEGVKKIFIYHPALITSKIKNYDKPKESLNWIEIISMDAVLIKLPNHILSIKHEIVDSKLDIFQRGNIWDSRLLKTIYHSDPQVKYIGGRVNDIIKTIDEERINYRKCVYGYIL